MDIAVVGVSCRFPSDVNSATDLWGSLCSHSSCVSPLRQRNGEAFKQAKGSAAMLKAPFDFDPDCFALTTEQAACLDPSSRQLLMLAHELKWQCNSQDSDVIGLFLSLADSGFSHCHHPDKYNYELATGHYSSLCTGRIARHLKSTGPALQLDSASSSSLLSVHYAMKALKDNECSIAFAGGVNLISHPKTGDRWTELGALSSGPQSRPFSAESDGFVRGEGGALVALRRLDEALENGDPIYGIIKASAVVQDWHSETLTAPSVQGQVEMLEKALQQSGWGKDDLDYIEAHGSGTPVGDTIELEALHRTFAGRKAVLPVGSGKGHHGHLEVAAGVAGLIKVLSMFAYQHIPATLTQQPIHPSLIHQYDLELVTQLQRADLKRAGVTSLGMGGTQVHLLLEHFQRDKPLLPVPLVLSAATQQELDVLIQQLSKAIDKAPEDWGKLVWSATCQAKPAQFVLCAELENVEQIKTLTQGKLASEPSRWKEEFEKFIAGEAVNWSLIGRRFALLPLLNYPFTLSTYWPSDINSERAVEQKANGAELYTQDTILDWLCKESSQLTGSKIFPDLGLFSAGLTSFQAGQLRQSIQEKFGFCIPPTLIFNHPNALALSREIYKRFNNETSDCKSNLGKESCSKENEQWMNELIFELSD